MENKSIELQEVQSVLVNKKPYAEPVLEKREQLVEVVETALPVSGVVF